MNRVEHITFHHEPSYFQFYVRDYGCAVDVDADFSDELIDHGFAVRSRLVAIGTVSDFSEIPVTVVVSLGDLGADGSTSWDRLAECSVECGSGSLVLEGCTGGEFGRIDLEPGRYRLRIHWGGQGTVKPDGQSEDYYLLQLWPSSG